MTGLSHVNAQGEAHMVGVGGKPPLRRIAIAAGDILLNTETIRLIQDNGMKKGDVLGVARIAGIQAAKLTPQLIPLCHNVTLDAVDVEFVVGTDRVSCRSRAECIGRTGVEMEAITAVSVALVTIYDMCKAVDKTMSITGIRLLEKHKLDPAEVQTYAGLHGVFGAAICDRGQQSGPRPQVAAPLEEISSPKHHGRLKVVIVTLSDRAASGVYDDKSGPKIQSCMEQHELASRWTLAIERILISDDAARLRAELDKALAGGIDVILTTGGTGVGNRDMAPDVVKGLIEKELPGIMESIRGKYGQAKPMARLSRGVAGVRGTCQLYTLPGSVKAVDEYMSEILKTMEHIVFLLRGIDPHA